MGPGTASEARHNAQKNIHLPTTSISSFLGLNHPSYVVRSLLSLAAFENINNNDHDSNDGLCPDVKDPKAASTCRACRAGE
jgi:hypothetical protein